ncbi:hypothetical protein, variant [Aphanomyces astaci]|uniref:Integrator complex subunit 3 n=1 Tax=Aphanomyces astaci TaxID=112090 RepID=W4FP30_APHAT|nr:hypothetical protein, variant [Aphanomyces astaci]ETV68564.1 hypothetical protein, variant [Aphanomyces astaci]|eukprot:XP_009841993.1 hypothetical protein, variant [Aphanomyces astaci]
MSDSPPPPPPSPPPASPKAAAAPPPPSHDVPPPPSPQPPAVSGGPPRLGRANSLVPAPSSKLLVYVPLDAPDDLDRNWAWHYMTAQKQLTGDMADLDKWKTVDGFEKHTALVYGLLTDSKEIFWALLRTFWNDNQAIKDKTFQGLHALVDIRFLRLAPSCRANLLWLVEQCIHDSVNVDALLIVLMRYVGVPCADAEPSLLEWLVRVVATPAIWDSIVPHIAFTLLSILPELYATKPNDAVTSQVIHTLLSLHSNHARAMLVAGRELVRLVDDAIPLIPAVAPLQAWLHTQSLGLTPSKFVVGRLTFKVHEHLRFVLDKVTHVAAHRYQKWFQAAFLQGQSAFEGRIADLIRFVCAVHQPSSQAVELKMTPRYHILGWLFLLNKTAAAKTRVLHAMYFDFLHYSPDIPVLQLEPAMMLLLKATKNRNHGMVQDIMTFLVARVDGAPDVAAKVAAAISALIKLGMMRNLLPLVDYLGEFHPALGKQSQAALPLHFTPRAPGHTAITSSPNQSNNSPSHHHRPSPQHSTPPTSSSPQRATSSPQRPNVSPQYDTSPNQHPRHHPPPSEDVDMASNWTEQSFLDDTHPSTPSPDRSHPLKTRADVAALAFPESLQVFREPMLALQLVQSDVDKVIPALSHVFVLWSDLANAVAVSLELGSLVYKCLERSFLTTTSVPQFVLDQCLQRPPHLHLPLLHGMYKQDSVLSSRLLAHCCVHNNLTPYIAFCDMVGLPDVPAAILQDIGLCVHVDQACALACSLLQVPYAGNVAVATTCLGVVPYLLEHAPLACMPRLDALIRSLVSVAPPVVVAKLSMRLLLSEFSIFKDQTATVLLSSLHWNSWEQWGVWELLSAEWQAKHHDKATVAALRKVLACLDPQTHGEALSGILRLLLQICPDMALLQCVLKLSDAFDPFPSRLMIHISCVE